LFKSSAYISALQVTSNLVRDGQALRFENFCLLDLPSVPLVEQRTIADFLDKSTSIVDSILHKKKEQLRILDEAKGGPLRHSLRHRFFDAEADAAAMLDRISFSGRDLAEDTTLWLSKSQASRRQLHSVLVRQLARLREYRDALVSDAVTGRVEVTREIQ
jgi:hypothetical protein